MTIREFYEENTWVNFYGEFKNTAVLNGNEYKFCSQDIAKKFEKLTRTNYDYVFCVEEDEEDKMLHINWYGIPDNTPLQQVYEYLIEYMEYYNEYLKKSEEFERRMAEMEIEWEKWE